MLVTKIHGGWKWSAGVSYSDQQHEVKVKTLYNMEQGKWQTAVSIFFSRFNLPKKKTVPESARHVTGRKFP